MRCKGLLTSALAAFVAVSFGVAPAGANLDNNEVGAAAVVPYITGSGAETLVTVTNAKDTGIVLEIRLIEGVDFDEGLLQGQQQAGNWDVESYQCELTGNETVLFAIDENESGDGATVASASLSCNTLRAVATDSGLIFFSVQGDDGNAIFADWAVVDFESNRSPDFAFGAEAISFQAGPVVNVDDVFVFDGTEYSEFPSALSTNFLFPDQNCILGDETPEGGEGNETRCAALLLFTLDGAAGFPPPVQANIDFYDQYENPFDADWDFDCFSLVHLWEISPNLTRQFNQGSEAGHMVLKASNSVRSPFHGWIIQSDDTANNPGFPQDPNDPEGPGFDTNGMWARTLAQSTANFVPEPGGTVAFDDD